MTENKQQTPELALLYRIDHKLDALDARMGGMERRAVVAGAVAGGVSGGVVAVAIGYIKAKFLGL